MELEWRWKGPGAERLGARAAIFGLIFGLIFTVLGLGFLGLGGGFALWTQQFVKRSMPVQGTVTALREVDDAQNHSVTFAPVFSFVASDGRSHSIPSNSSSNPAGYSVGDAVRVLYDPDNPQGAKIDSFWQLWGIAVVFAAVGGVFTTIGIPALIIARIQRRRELEARGAQPWMMNSDVAWSGRNPGRNNIDPM